MNAARRGGQLLDREERLADTAAERDEGEQSGGDPQGEVHRVLLG